MEHPAEAANTALALYKLLKEIVRDHAGEKELPKPEDFRDASKWPGYCSKRGRGNPI
ncbi:MAG: hypothetical protein LUQ38_04580 [Methanotrichaceae archaeon]|nr:hypothetical protein [Methanotrichaceae archaeon]